MSVSSTGYCFYPLSCGGLWSAKRIRELEIVATATKADLNTCQEKLELEQKIVQVRFG